MATKKKTTPRKKTTDLTPWSPIFDLVTPLANQQADLLVKLHALGLVKFQDGLLHIGPLPKVLPREVAAYRKEVDDCELFDLLRNAWANFQPVDDVEVWHVLKRLPPLAKPTTKAKRKPTTKATPKRKAA